MFSNEINEFIIIWSEYKNKIKDQQNILNDSIKKQNDNSQIKRNNAIINKDEDNGEFKEKIKDAIKFIKININNIRLRDKSKMQYLKGMLEKMIIIIIKYFKDVKIRNYIGFIEKMKNKFLSQFKIENDKEVNNENKEIMNESKDKNILSGEDTINSQNFENSQSLKYILII